MKEAQKEGLSVGEETVYRRLVSVFRDTGLDRYFDRSKLQVDLVEDASPLLSLGVARAVANRLTERRLFPVDHKRSAGTVSQ